MESTKEYGDVLNQSHACFPITCLQNEPAFLSEKGAKKIALSLFEATSKTFCEEPLCL